MMSSGTLSDDPSVNLSGSRPKRALYVLAGSLVLMFGLSAFFVIGAVAGLVAAGMSG